MNKDVITTELVDLLDDLEELKDSIKFTLDDDKVDFFLDADFRAFGEKHSVLNMHPTIKKAHNFLVTLERTGNFEDYSTACCELEDLMLVAGGLLYIQKNPIKKLEKAFSL